MARLRLRRRRYNYRVDAELIDQEEDLQDQINCGSFPLEVQAYRLPTAPAAVEFHISDPLTGHLLYSGPQAEAVAFLEGFACCQEKIDGYPLEVDDFIRMNGGT